MFSNFLYFPKIGAIQLASSVMSIQKENNSIQLDVALKIAGADLFDNHLLIWAESKILIYQLGLTNSKPVIVGNFSFINTQS